MLRELARVEDERGRAEPALSTTYRADAEEARLEEEVGRLRHEQRRDKRIEELDEEIRLRREAVAARYAAEAEAATKKHGKACWELKTKLANDKQAADAAVKEAIWTAETLLEGGKADADKRLREENDLVATRMGELESIRQTARDLIEEHDLAAPDVPAVQVRPTRGLEACVEEAQSLLDRLRRLRVLPFLKGGRLFGLVFLAGVLLIYPLGLLMTSLLGGDSLAMVIGLGGAAAAVLSVGLGFAFQALARLVARQHVAQVYVPLGHVVAEAEVVRDDVLDKARTSHRLATDAAEQRYEQEKEAAHAKHQQAIDDEAYQRTIGQASLDHRLESEKQAAELRRETDSQAIDLAHKKGMAQIEERFQTRLTEALTAVAAKRDESVTRHQKQWQERLSDWKAALACALSVADDVGTENARLFPAWNDPSWVGWKPPAAPQVPDVFRFGSYHATTKPVVETEPWREGRPSPATIDLTLPALCPFAEPTSLLFHTNEGGRDQAIDAMRAVLLRMLTCMAPGRVRFLIIDPVGLGQSFGAFMNLADFDEKLVGSRIWTEANHIEHRLADLTGHMENVIQKYLRNRYPTIAEYNAEAGEVAEPYRVLVVANFPANFTVEAMRRLVSIAQSGPRCGISVVASVDHRQQMPKGFDLADIESHAINLDWEASRFRWRDDDFGRHDLMLDPPPDDALANRVLHLVGEGAKAAQRVEVPFEFIAPPADQLWTSVSRKGLGVPLGRAGATRRQLLELGRGTSQHVLVAGKTGSGKSTLLHAMIVNLGLMYSPDEVELYLVDFKKGVEFKVYTTHDLPHARVVAIESEREFGLSVLQRLDAEIASRGESFRKANVQDLNAYREEVPDARLPRILLIVDEFQEFFTEDDKLAQEAARLLDRLVRQGRAFGMHVLLGSQTIGGAFSLARSTIDQMAVRIALQCSEADAHLILSDDNSAARLLSRPGEAIYNDANGRVEGNNPFQVVWLGDDQRENYLTRMRELAAQRPTKPRTPMVVFEGNAAADPSKNHLLTRLLTSPAVVDESPTRGEHAWLGEAMAIDELTSAAFRRQNGSNLVIVGQQAESALGMLVTGLVGLAAHDLGRAAHEVSGFPDPLTSCAARLPRFTVIDGHHGDAPRNGILPELRDTLPEPMRLAGTRELPDVLTELSAELERRQASPDADAPSLYLVLHGVQRMRDLRRAEDDFGMMGRADDKPATPDKQLAAILREGPVLGIHVLVWCDTLNNLNRVFDRQAMRELSMRVVFQMSVADSSNLIDSPAASKLGMYRALFVSEEEGRLEKFRPYGVPPDGWLAWVKDALLGRAALTRG